MPFLLATLYLYTFSLCDTYDIKLTCLCNMLQIFTAVEFYYCKNDNFHMKNHYFFLISAQNIDCGNPIESLNYMDMLV